MQAPELVRFTPALPNPEEVANNSTLIRTDHLGTLFSAYGLTIVSLNVLSPDLFSAYEPYQRENIDARKILIVRSVENIIAANPIVDVIFLQEDAWLSKAALQPLLAQGWQVLGDEDKKILYRTMGKIDKFIKSREAKGGVFGLCAIHSFQLKPVKEGVEGEVVDLVNVHGEHKDFPDEHKNALMHLLSSGEKVIVAGDFNCRIAPQSKDVMNIVTALVPKNFRGGRVGCDWTDGAFMGGSHEDGPHGKPVVTAKQVEVTLLNPATGLKVDTKILPEFKDEFQKAETSQMRACLTVGESSLGKFEFWLQGKLSVPEVHVFSAANAFNHKGVVICSPQKQHADLFQKLHAAIPELVWTTVDGDRGQIRVISMTAAQFVIVEEWLRREMLRIAADSSRLTRAFRDPSPLCFTQRLQALVNLSAKLSDHGDENKNVLVCRNIKDELNQFAKSANPLTAMIAKMAMADYYLRITEYTDAQVKLMKAGEKRFPACILRPMHLSSAMILCTELMDSILDPNFQAALSPLDKEFLGTKLVSVCAEMNRVFESVRDDINILIRLYDKAEGNQEATNSDKLRYEQAGRTLEDFAKFKSAFEKLLKVFPRPEQDGCQLM